MYFVGGDHYNNRIPHNDLQIFCHRVYAKIPRNLPDDQLRHRLYYDVFKTNSDKNDFYTRDDINLCNFLADCKVNNIVPIVNNNATYLDPTIPVEEYARRSRLIDQLIYDNGFELAYNAHMNEPGKRHSTPVYTNCTNAAIDQIKHYDSIVGNDEYNMLDWHYLMANTKAKIIGVHPLSSLGYPPVWKILWDWKTMANQYGKEIVISEGGSWVKSYFSAEGYKVIKDTILKAKALGYLATLIVLLDCNEGSYPKLGFNRLSKDYKILESVSDYWEGNEGDNFINLVNSEGQKYKEEQMPEYNVPDKLKAIADELGNVVGKYEPELPVLTGTGIWQNAVGHKKNDPLLKADFDATVEKILKMFGIDISVYYKPDGSWNPAWRDIAKSNPKL